MAKLKKESKPVKEKTNKVIAKKQQKSPKTVGSKKLKDKLKVKLSTNSVNEESVTVKVKKVQEKPEAKLSLNVDNDQILRGIQVLLQYCDKNLKNLFDSDNPVFAQVTSIKIPQGPNRRLRLNLKHSLHTDGSEICLIVPDLKRGRKQDHEPTIEHYEELLRSHGITCIKRILPMRQIKVEYDQYELKRKLCGYYNCFLVDAKISGHVAHLLGNEFFEKRKLPTPVRMDGKNLKGAIERALHKVQMNIHPKGNSYGVQIGSSSMAPEILADNLKSCIEDLSKSFPGGWGNIRAVYVKTDKSIAIPVYLTLKSSNEVPVPVVHSLRPKSHKEVRGELSTKLNSDVTISPSGETTLHPLSSEQKLAEKKQIQKKGKKTVAQEELMDEDDNTANNNGNGADEIDSDNFNDTDDEEDVATKAEQKYMKNLKANKKKKIAKKSK